jgi:hypothetical protein
MNISYKLFLEYGMIRKIFGANNHDLNEGWGIT